MSSPSPQSISSSEAACSAPGTTRLFQLYGQPTDGFAPVVASMLTEVGLAFVVGSLLKFWHIRNNQGPGADDHAL